MTPISLRLGLRASQRSIPFVLRSMRSPTIQRMVMRRWQSSYQPPTPQSEQTNPHRAFYASFGYPVLKAFLGALFTYQVLYFAWLKLESVETKHDKTGEIEGLQSQLKDLTQTKN